MNVLVHPNESKALSLTVVTEDLSIALQLLASLEKVDGMPFR